MRLRRPLALLSTVAAATLILAGCAGSPEAGGSPSPSPSSSSGCMLNTKPGAGSDAVKVDGSGLDAKITVPKDTKISEVERTVVKKGDGKEIKPGDFVSARYQLVDAETGEVLDTSKRGPEGVLPLLLNPNQQQQISDFTQSSIFVVAAECVPVGSEVVLTIPASRLGEGAHSVALYVQTLEKLPTTATGKEVPASSGDLATVKLGKDGAPTITVPKTAAPTETTISVLKQGDGPVVGSGDLVTVQYRGVKWSDGKEFDSSWGRAAFPSQFATTQVVSGFGKALEGQKVGSQILAEIPPKDGYGASKGHELEKETLVFVIDILGTTPAEK